jgi:bifunctional N-acetylglucosamine-1-phosphate-uridyltransferase/glucosamine-1-phosphate-acetyltransferase GlmU-like protein
VSGEYYLTDIASLALYEGKKVETVPMEPQEALGINSPEDAELAEALHAAQK